MSDTLYMQFDLNVKVDHPKLQLQDLAKLACSNAETLNRCRVFPILTLPAEKEGRYVVNVTDLIEKLCRAEKNTDFVPTGEPSFLITYQKAQKSSPFVNGIKIVAISIVTFFGMAFSIMTFNNDVNIGGLFSQIYEKTMGRPSSGYTILEISYSIGIALGILLFFNHFGKWKFSEDPTPMQVQMRLYEDDVNHTILEDIEREKGNTSE